MTNVLVFHRVCTAFNDVDDTVETKQGYWHHTCVMNMCACVHSICWYRCLLLPFVRSQTPCSWIFTFHPFLSPVSLYVCTASNDVGDTIETNLGVLELFVCNNAFVFTCVRSVCACLYCFLLFVALPTLFIDVCVPLLSPQPRVITITCFTICLHSIQWPRRHNRNQSRHCLCVMSMYACVYSTQLIRLFLSPFCSTAHLLSRVNVYYTYTIHNYNPPLNLLIKLYSIHM